MGGLPQNKLLSEKHKVIYINAWETDFDDEPLIPIISSLLDGVNSGKGLKKLKSALRETLGAAALVTNNLVGHVTGINIYEIEQEVERDLNSTDIQKVGEEIYKEFSFKQRAYNTLRNELSAYIENLEKKPLVVFVDELDRVRPDYAVKFLEAIKHIFSIQGVVFVLAVDRRQLEAAVKQLYGEIDFENYYRRFVTREAELPETNKIDLMPFIDQQAVEFFDEKRIAGVSFPFKPNEQQEIMRFVCNVCRAFRFVPRQIESFFRIFSQFMAVTPQTKTIRKSWIEAATILIAIFIDDRDLYHRIGNATVPLNEFHEYLQSLDYSFPPNNGIERYVVFTAMAFCLRSEHEEEKKEIVNICNQYDSYRKSDELSDEKIKETIANLSRRLDDFGHLNYTTSFQHIYSRLEEWRTFIE